MSLQLSEIFSLSDSKRRRIGFVRKSRGRYRKEERAKRTPDELVAWLRENNIRLSRQVEKVRKDGDPTLSDFRLAFSKWKDATDSAFGFREMSPNVDDPEYMAKVVVQFGLWSVSSYLDARRKRPDVVPSYRAVKRRWGGFRRLKAIAIRGSLLGTVNAYLALRRRLGRIPTQQECLNANVIIDKAVEFYGSKRKLDLFLSGREKKK